MASKEKVEGFFDLIDGHVIDWGEAYLESHSKGVAVISAEKHKRQRRERQSVTAKRQKAQTPKFSTAILTLPNMTLPNLN